MADTGEDPGSETEPDWKFSVDEFADESEEGGQRDGEGIGLDADAGDADDGTEGNITGSLTTDEPLEPGEIDPENALFVLLGIALVAGLILGTILGL
ncbi:MAG: hypothetical protein V5A55_05480 [Halovenus sp.]